MKKKEEINYLIIICLNPVVLLQAALILKKKLSNTIDLIKKKPVFMY